MSKRKKAETGVVEGTAPVLAPAADPAVVVAIQALLARYPTLPLGYYDPATGDVRFSDPTPTHLEIKR